MSYYLDCQCETCLKREGESLGRNIVIHSIILNGMPENVVTHADYRALEEDRDMWFRDHGIVETELREAREELAALRVRVGDVAP